MAYGFIRVAAAVPRMKVADCVFNADNIISMINDAFLNKVHIVAFPELCITGYTCGDLFHQKHLIDEAQNQLSRILNSTKDINILFILGMPVIVDNQQFNAAVVCKSGRILGVVPKSYIPGYKEFYEERWFSPANAALSKEINICGQTAPLGDDVLFECSNINNVVVGVEICEDLWVPVPPSCFQALAGATLLFNLSASNEVIGKSQYRRQLVVQQSAKCIAGYVYVSSGVDESTTDVVFGGHSLIAENGAILAETQRFLRKEQLIFIDVDVDRLHNDRYKNTSFMEMRPPKHFRKVLFELPYTPEQEFELLREVDPYPFVPSDEKIVDERCAEIFGIQTTGLAKRIHHTGLKHVVIGISGGLDSTLALLVASRTYELLGMDKSNIITVTMPGFGTSGTTYENAINLMKAIGTTIREIDIKAACMQHFKDIGHDPAVHDVTYENVQARERTQILMDIANKEGGLVIGTGDLSELVLGWATYNGDHMSMYSVNCSVPKTLVKYLVKYVADHVADEKTSKILGNILDTPISPELLPPDEKGNIQQKTEDIVGPYELHDFFMYHVLRYGAPPKKVLYLACKAFKGKYAEETIKKWLITFYKRFFSQQFKRSCLPDGPKVGSISVSPRGDLRMPSDACVDIWVNELEKA